MRRFRILVSLLPILAILIFIQDKAFSEIRGSPDNPELIIDREQENNIQTVALSKNGQNLALAGYVGEPFLGIWQIDKGGFIWKVSPEIEWTTALSFSPDGKYLMMTACEQLGCTCHPCWKNRIIRWDTSNGTKNNEINGDDIEYKALVYSSDGKKIITAECAEEEVFIGKKGTEDDPEETAKEKNWDIRLETSVKIWDAKDLKLMKVLHKPTYCAGSLFVDEKNILYENVHNDLILWDLQNYRKVRVIKNVGESATLDKRKTLLAGANNTGLRLARFPENRSFRIIKEKDINFSHLLFSSDKRYLFYVGTNPETFEFSRIYQWDIPGRRLTTTIKYKGYVNSLFLLPEKEILLVAGTDSLNFYALQDGRLLMTFTPLENIEWITQTPDGYFDISEGSKSLINWNSGRDTFPKEKYWSQYYRHGLYRKILNGEKIE